MLCHSAFAFPSLFKCLRQICSQHPPCMHGIIEQMMLMTSQVAQLPLKLVYPAEPIPIGTAGISSFGLEACVVLNAVNTGSSIVCGGNNPDAACCSSSACFDSTFWDTTRPADPFVSLGADGKLTCGSSYEPACCPLAPHEL